MKNRLTSLLVIIMVVIFGWAGKRARCPNGPQQGSPGLNMKFIEDLVIKSAGPNREYSFFAAGVESDSRGNIYVLNSHDLNILMFNEKGDFLGTIGKKGQGPGEFEAPSSMFIDHQDNLYVHDVVRMGLAVFDKNGQFIRNIKGTGFLAWTSKFMIDRGLNIVCGYQPLISIGERDSYLISKFDRNFKLIRNIYEKDGVITTYRIRAGGNFLSVHAPRYTPGVVWTLDHEGRIYAGYNASYDIQILSDKGELIKNIHRDVKPAKIPEEEKKQIQDEYEKRYPAVFRLIKIPQVRPVFLRLYMVEDSLFVLRERVGLDYFYDVFNKAGEYLGESALGFQPFVSKNGFVYTIRPIFEGEARPDNIIDVEIIRYRIIKETGKFSMLMP